MYSSVAPRQITLMTKRALVALAVAGLSACTPKTAPTPVGPQYDMVIANGRIVDGTGNGWFYGDIGITGDKITKIAPGGGIPGTSSKAWINAVGQVVAPGFIDIQSHSWDELLWADGRVVGKVTQGVTTEILGEATTPAPINDAMMKLEDIPDTMPKLIALYNSFRGAHGFGAWLD